VEVAWAHDALGQDTAPVGYMVTVQADALGRPRLLADLTAAISAVGADIVSASVEPPQELRVRHRYTVELPDAGLLPGLMRAMLRVAGVYDVYRAVPQTANPDDGPGEGVRPSSSSGIRSTAGALSDEEAVVPLPGPDPFR
jgi:GTP pyrophosphokinase